MNVTKMLKGVNYEFIRFCEIVLRLVLSSTLNILLPTSVKFHKCSSKEKILSVRLNHKKYPILKIQNTKVLGISYVF